ncbi:tRNA(adenine34) deaminase [Parahypoxylon ruwenzoriense]
MTGHESSRYMSSFWQALFALFIQLINRIFHFATPKEGTQQPQAPQAPQVPKNPQKPQAPQQPPSTHSTSTSPSPSPSPNPNLLSSLTSIPDSELDLAASQLPHNASSVDLKQALDSESQDDDVMAPSRKRGGQKRGGSQSNGSRSNGHNYPPPGPSNGVANASTANQYPVAAAVSKDSAPVGVTPVANQRDTKGNSRQADGQKSAGTRRGSRNHGPTPPKPSDNARKENAVVPKNLPNAPLSQSPALKPLSPENQAQDHGTGTDSQHTATASRTFGKLGMENAPASKQVRDVGPDIGRLTLDDIPGIASSEELSQPIITPTATTEARGPLPPVLVAIPLPRSLDSKPAATTPTPTVPSLPGLVEPKTDEERAERAYHLKFMREALDMGNLALSTNETPVGCVLVQQGRIIAKGMNATNVTRNGTRHAEFMALSALFSRKKQSDAGGVNTNSAPGDATWEDVNPQDGHIYPYGQKLHPAPAVDHSIIAECILYVTVEPCVMCASLLRQLGIKKVYFGAVNDKFGGTGGVFRIHLNSKPVSKPIGRPYQNGYGPQETDRICKGRATPLPRNEDDGDGGNVECGYPVEGGYLRDEAVSLLRRFYVQENGRAPQPRKKEGRAARLFAMENQTKNGTSASELSDAGTLPDTPVMDPEMPVDDDEKIRTTDGATAA